MSFESSNGVWTPNPTAEAGSLEYFNSGVWLVVGGLIFRFHLVLYTYYLLHINLFCYSGKKQFPFYNYLNKSGYFLKLLSKN